MIPVPEYISTQRLRLRRPKASDAAAVFEYGRDPDVARYMDWTVVVEFEDAVRATQRAIQRWETGEEYAWRLTLTADDTPLGGVACTLDGHRADLGFLLSRQHWGQGYATEATRAVFDWLVSVQTVQRIQATCDTDNRASARVLEKLGMVREGVLRNWAVRPNLPGQPVRDAILYAWARTT